MKYRLLKDLPDAKVGTILEMEDKPNGLYMYVGINDEGVPSSWYIKEIVENNPDWFELINERIEVISVRFCILPNENSVEINFDKKIKVSQFPLIKQAIENAINS